MLPGAALPILLGLLVGAGFIGSPIDLARGRELVGIVGGIALIAGAFRPGPPGTDAARSVAGLVSVRPRPAAVLYRYSPFHRASRNLLNGRIAIPSVRRVRGARHTQRYRFSFFSSANARKDFRSCASATCPHLDLSEATRLVSSPIMIALATSPDSSNRTPSAAPIRI